MRIRDLVNRYLHASSTEMILEGVTKVFFNPLTRGVQEYYTDDIKTALKEDERAVKESLSKATEAFFESSGKE